MRPPARTQLATAVAGVLWLGGLVGGYAALLSFQASASSPTTPSREWPTHSTIAASDQLPTLVVFAHPLCPCTRATIGELERIVARCEGRLRVVVAFLALPEFDGEASRSDLWNAAASIPGVEVTSDRDGTSARVFGVSTSGHALLFDKSGRLRFEGGITSSRGHAGDNAGESAVIDIVRGTIQTSVSTPVFGCPLF